MSREPARPMSTYDQRRWEELNHHWERKLRKHDILAPLPQGARERIAKSGEIMREKAGNIGRKASALTPQPVKDAGALAASVALAPTAGALVHALELVNDWVVELSDPDAIIKQHQKAGRDVRTLADVRAVDLEVLDKMTNTLVLRWRTLGSGEGAALGSLAMIPVPGLGSALAIGMDLVATQLLSTAIATRVCYSYGFEPDDPRTEKLIERMVRRSFAAQAGKAGTMKEAGLAWTATKDRVNWSSQLRENQKLLSAVEQLMKRFNGAGPVPVKNARMGMPGIAIAVGAGTNAYVLGDVAKQARNLAATIHLCEKYGLPMPEGMFSTDDEAGTGVHGVASN